MGNNCNRIHIDSYFTILVDNYKINSIVQGVRVTVPGSKQSSSFGERERDKLIGGTVFD